jgi:hypothetical protein
VAITVAEGLPARIHSGVPVTLWVLSTEDPVRLDAALRAAANDIAALGEGQYRYPEVTDPIAIPGGYAVVMDLTTMPGDLAVTVTDLMVARLSETGAAAAQISGAPEAGDRYSAISSFAPVAQAWLRGVRDRNVGKGVSRRLDTRLVDVAIDWLRQEYRDDMERIALAVAAEVPFDWESAATAARGILGPLSGTTLFVTDFSSAIASAVLGAFSGTGLSLMAAGADWPAAEIVHHMRGQRDLIRAHATALTWAGVTAQTDNRYLLSGYVSMPAPVPGPLWYQLLADQHVAELGGPPEGAVELPGGRTELTVGEPEQWVPGHPDRDAVMGRARRLITPLA